MRRGVPAFLLLAMLFGCQAGPSREVVFTDRAPAPVGPFSQAIRSGNTLWVSGQLGIDPATGTLAAGVEAQTRQALQNIKVIVEAAGFTMGDVVQCQVFLEDIDDYQRMNAVYASVFPQAPPARAAVEVAELPRNGKVEILAVAVR
jgi:2-iminobutanoate/2-iminopropanoate deaminase